MFACSGSAADQAEGHAAADAGMEGTAAAEAGAGGEETTFRNCAGLCGGWAPGEVEGAEATLRAAFPALPMDARDARLLRRRRCAACQAVSAAMADMRAQVAGEAFFWCPAPSSLCHRAGSVCLKRSLLCMRCLHGVVQKSS